MPNSLLDTALGNLSSSQEKPQSLLDQSLNTLAGFDTRQEQTMGRFGVGESKYDTEITPTNVSQLNEVRAQRQPSALKIGSGLVNAVTQTGLDVIKDASYLLDMENYTDFKKSAEEGFGNWVADAMQATEDKLKLPVYRTKESQGFAPWSAGWWGDNIPSILSTVSMVLPAEAGVYGLSKMGKLMGGEKLIRGIESATGLKEVGGALEGITGAVLSRQMENLMEGSQTYQETYQKALQETGDEAKAKQVAGEAASKNYALNWVALLQDIPEYMFLHKTFKEASTAFSAQGLKEAAKIAGVEGSEEAYQFITDKESQRSALVNNKVIKDDGSNFAERLVDYAKDGNLWTAAFLGALGGGLFGAYGVHKNNKEQSKYDALLEAHKGVLTGDKDTYYRGVDQSFNDIVSDKAADNKLEDFAQGLKYLASNPTRIQDDSRPEVTQRLNEKIQDVEYAQTLQKNIINDESIPADLKKLTFNARLNQRTTENRLQRINGDLFKLNAKDALVLDQPADVLEYKRAKLLLEELMAKGAPGPRINELKKTVASVGNELLEAYPSRFKSIKELDSKLPTSNDTELRRLLYNKEVDSNQLDELRDISSKLGTEEGKTEFQTKIEKARKAAEKQAAEAKEEVKQTQTPDNFEAQKADIESRRAQELASVPDEGLAAAVNQKYDQEASELEEQYKDKTKVVEDFQSVNTQAKVSENPKTRNAKTPYKTESGLDDDSKPSRNRYFRYIEKNKISGYKLLVVTKNNNAKLYNELVALDETAKLYEEEFKKENKGAEYQGIYTVLVDKSNNIVKANEKGQVDEKGSIVFSTLTTPERIENEEITVADKKTAIKDLIALRTKLLAAKNDVFLNISDKSKGWAQFEPTVNGVRQSHSILGRLGNFLDEISLELPTLAIEGTDKVILKNGQLGYTGRLYGFDKNSRAVDLIPRTLTAPEIETMVELINQRMGITENQTGDVSLEIEKLIYFGIPKTGANENTIGVAKGSKNLTLGTTSLTPEQLATPEGQQALRSFLNTKRVNVNSKYSFDDQFVDASGKRWNSYKEYLLSGDKPMFGTDLVTSDKPQFRNQYLIYDPTIKVDNIKITKEDKKEEKEVLQKARPATEEELKELFSRFPEEEDGDIILPGELDRVASITTTNTPLTKDEINWFKSSFPNVPIERVKGLIDNKALGRFLNAGTVLLSDEATVGTLRHEAFHTVTQLYLTEEEIAKLYKETKSRLNVKTDLEAEEALAEDFANYKTNKTVLGKASERNHIFKRLLDFIRDLLNLPISSIQDIYRRLDKGFYTNKPIVGVRQFSKLDKALPGKSEVFTKDLLDGIDAIFFTTLFNNNFTPSKLRETQGLTPAIMKRVYNRIGKLKNIALDVYEANPNNAAALQAIKNYTYALNNWEQVQEAWKSRAASIGIEVKLREDEDPNVEESVVEDENKEARSGEAYQEANLVSQKSIMSLQSKMLIRSLKLKNPDGSDKLNSLGLPTVVNFNTTYNFLLKQLSGLLTYSDIYNKLKELSVAKPELVDLYQRLGEPSSAINFEQFMFQQQFRQDFAKNQSTSFKTILNANGSVFLIDANKENTSGRIKDSWKNAIKGKATQNAQGELMIDPEIAKAGTSIEFLENIGWTLSPETKEYLKEEQPEWFNTSVTAIRNYITRHKGDISNLFESKERTGENTDEVSNIERLATLEADFNPEAAELSFLSTEGKTVYSINLNNALSIIKNAINNSKTKDELFKKLPHLNTVSTEGSIWLDQLFDEKGNKRKDREVKLDLHDGLRTGSDVKGANKFANSTRKIAAGDKYVQEYTSILLDGRSSYVRASDKSSEFTLSLNKYSKSQKLAIPLDKLKKGFDITEVKDIFNNYFKAELKRIAFYRLEGLGKDLDIYNKAGNNFTIFSDILSRDTKANIQIILDKLNSRDMTHDEVVSTLEAIAPTFYEQVGKDVVTFLNNYTDELENALKENNVSMGQGLSKEDFGNYTTEQLSRAVAVNDLINSIEQTKLFIGDMAFYKDLFKRTSAMTGTKQTASNGAEVNEWLENNNKRADKKVEDGRIHVAVFEDSNQALNEEYMDEYIDALVQSGMTEAQAKSTLTAYTSMDEGDAQGWITLDELRSFEIRMGHWTTAKEALFDKVQKGEKLTPEELVLFTVKKAQYAGPQEYKGLYAPAYHKYSLLPLIPQMIEGKNLSRLLNAMREQKVGYALFKSGSKVGTRVDEKGKANKFYTDTNNGEVNTKDWQLQTVSYDFLGLQTETPNPKEQVIFGTQFRKLLFTNLFEGGKEAFEGNEKLLKEYNTVIDTLVNREKEELIRELGVNPESYKAEDVTKIVSLLQDQARSRNLADNLIDSIQSEVIDGKLMLKYKFDAMVNKAKIDSMLMSLVNSRLIRQKINGDALIQVASSGFEDAGKREAGTNDALLFYRKGEDGKTLPAEVMIAMNKNYTSLLKKYETIEKLNKAISKGEIDKQVLEFVAYRIPTQGLNSMEYFTIKEFLPEESSTAIVLPTAIVAKSGGDYDVDKLNVIRPEITKEGNYKFTSENRIIEIAKEILSNEKNLASLITPNSNKILTSVVDEMRYIQHLNDKPEYKGTVEEYNKDYKRNLANIRYTNQLKLTTKIAQFIKFLTAKDMIGIAAVQNTHHILAQQNNLSITDEYVGRDGKTKEKVSINLDHNMTSDGRVDLSRIKDVAGNNQISEVISQILTSSVDAAKDPFVFDLNMTKDTLSTYLFLIRAGVPFENIAYFMRQPIITEYLKRLTINSSGFLKAIDAARNQKEIANGLLADYKYLTRRKVADIPIRSLGTEELKGYLKKSNQTSQEFYETQIQVLNDYLRYKEYAGMLGEAIRATNQDTAGVGKSLESIRKKIASVEQAKAVGFVRGIDDILNKSLIKTFNQLEFTEKTFSQFYYTHTPEFNKVKDTIFNIVKPRGDTNSNKLLTLVENDLISFVVQNWGYPNAEALKTKLFDTDSVARKILDIKNKKNKTSDEQAIANNLFVKELYPLLRTKDRPTDNLKVYVKRYDTFTANQLTESFRELKDLNPGLAKEIMDLGILQSGLNNSPITYLGLIPYEYYNDVVKQAFKNYEEKNGAKHLDKFVPLFLRNNKFNALLSRVDVPDPKLGNDIYGKDYNLNLEKEEAPKDYKSADYDDSYFPDLGGEEQEDDEIQFSRKNTPVEQQLIDSNFISKFRGELWIKKFFYGEAIRFINAMNRITPGLLSVEKINRVGEGGRAIHKVVINPINPQLSAQFNKTEGGEAITKEVANKILDDFSRRLGVEAELTTPEELKKMLGARYNNEPALFYKNKVYLTQLDLDDTIHEFIHPFVDSLATNNYILFERLMEDVIKDNPEIYEEVERLYGEDFEEGQPTLKAYKEMATRAITKLAKENIDSTTGNVKDSALQRLWQAIKDLIQRILGVDTVAVKDLSPNTTLQELADLVSAHQGTINLGSTNPLEEPQAKRAKDMTPEEQKSAQESPYKTETVFFGRRIKHLKKQQEKYKEGTPEYNKLQEEITDLEGKLTDQLTETSVKQLGEDTLAKASEYIKSLEEGNTEAEELKEKNIRYAKDVIDIFLENEDLAGEAIKLRKRLYPFINKIILKAVNDHRTEKEEITQEMIDAQNKDIGTFNRATGSLSDQGNYIARTIGLVIKEAQNRVSTHRKVMRDEIQKQIDSLGEWGKKNGVSLDKIYDMFIQENKGTLILAKPYLENGEENKNYEKIQNTPELKKFYDFYQSVIDASNKFIPSKVGKNFIPNIERTTVKSTFRNLVETKESTIGDFVGNEDLYADVVHQKYLAKMEAAKKSRNLGDSLLRFASHAFQYEQLSEVLPEVRLLEEGLKYKLNSEGKVIEREFIKNSDPSKQVRGKDSNLAKMVSDIIDMQVKGKMKKDQMKIKVGNLVDKEGKVIGEKYVHASDIIDVALKYNSMLRIGFAPVTAAANVLFGDVSNIIEGVGGRFFGLKELHQATKIFMKQTLDKESAMNQWLEKLNPLQELDDYESVENKALKGKMSVEKFQEYMYSMQKQGEKFLQSRTMLAVLIREGYITKTGETTEKGKNISDKEAAQLSDKVQRLNQMIHGRYSRNEAAALQQNVLYRMAIQFRKWIPSAVEARLGEKRYDVRLGTEVEGRYRTFADLMFSKDIMSNLRKMMKGELSELEMYNMKKMMIELTMWAAATLLYAGLQGPDDDKEWKRNPFVKSGLSLLNRVSGDIAFFYSPEQATKITQNAIPLGKTASDLVKAIEYIPAAFYTDTSALKNLSRITPFEFGDYKFKKGSHKGQNKFYSNVGRLLPGIKPIYDIARLANDQMLEELQ